jgi:uncharacterized protein
MSERTLVDLEKLIRSGEPLDGEIAVSALTELADRLASQDGTLAWRLRGERDLHGRVRLDLMLDGRLQLVCQRCLGALSFPFEHRHALVVIRDEAAMPELEEEDDDADCVLLPGPFDVQEAVLEELLLALPMMPRHETEQCHGPEDGPDVPVEGRVSPFAVLRGSK